MEPSGGSIESVASCRRRRGASTRARRRSRRWGCACEMQWVFWGDCHGADGCGRAVGALLVAVQLAGVAGGQYAPAGGACGRRARVFAILGAVQRRATRAIRLPGLASVWTWSICRLEELASWDDAVPSPSHTQVPTFVRPGSSHCTLHSSSTLHTWTPASPPTTHRPPTPSQPWASPSKPSSRTGSCSACANAPACDHAFADRTCRCSPSAPCLSASSRRCRTAGRRPGAAWTCGTGYVCVRAATSRHLLTRLQQSTTPPPLPPPPSLACHDVTLFP